MKALKMIDKYFEEYVCMFLLTLMVLLITAQIFSRFLFNFSLDWSEELARFVFIWLIYISVSLAAKHHRHIRVEALVNALPPTLGKIIDMLANVVWLAFNGYMIFHGVDLVSQILSTSQQSAATGLNMGYIYAIVPFAFFIMSVRILQNIFKAFPKFFSNEPLKNPAIDQNHHMREI